MIIDLIMQKNMNNLKNFFNTVWHMQIINSIIVIILSIILYRGIVFLLNKSEEKSKSKLFTSKKGKTYVKLVRSIIRYVFLVITVLVILQVNGINVSSVLAGVGIFGVVFGLAIQDWLKDIIRGSSIISDDYFQVGDVVSYNGIEGKVLLIGLKTTKIQDMKTGNIISIANRKIEEIQVVSKLIYIRVPMPYDVSLKRAENAMESIVKLVKENENVEGCRYLGVTELADSSVQYLLEVTCNQQYKLQVRRDALKSVLMGLEKSGISVPYTQIDVHNK